MTKLNGLGPRPGEWVRVDSITDNLTHLRVTKTGTPSLETTTLKTTRTREEKWDARFLKMALGIADWSKDQSTKVGCVIVDDAGNVVSTGFNGLPRGLEDDVPARQERPEKYHWYEHGERNAIYSAARRGASVAGCTLYVTSTPSKFTCCTDCARGIIQSGIVRVVQEPLQFDSEAQKRWAESTDRVITMFKEAGVQYDNVSISADG